MVLPAATFAMVKAPFASQTAHWPEESTTVANSTGAPSPLSTAVPLRVKVCWAAAPKPVSRAARERIRMRKRFIFKFK